jgi:hypothetical protein
LRDLANASQDVAQAPEVRRDLELRGALDWTIAAKSFPLQSSTSRTMVRDPSATSQVPECRLLRAF